MPLPCKFKTSQHIVRKQDYATIILAVLISCAGFCLNAETVIIGSMLISNLTKPFTNLVVALYKLKWKVASLSILDIIYMTFITILISVLCGFTIIKIFPDIKKTITQGTDAFQKYRNDEITENELNKITAPMSCIFGRASLIKGRSSEYIFAILIAICGGILLARSHCQNSTLNTTIIGIGISTSILPPMVAAGIFTGIGSNSSYKHARYCTLVTLLNMGFIYLSYWFTMLFTW